MSHDCQGDLRWGCDERGCDTVSKNMATVAPARKRRYVGPYHAPENDITTWEGDGHDSLRHPDCGPGCNIKEDA